MNFGDTPHPQNLPSDPSRLTRELMNFAAVVLAITMAGAAPSRSITITPKPPLQTSTIPPRAAPAISAIVLPVNPTPAVNDLELLHDATLTSPAPKIIWMEVTAYCACSKCCGPNAHGVTASGKDVGYNDGAFVAADTDLLAFGTHISIPGYHEAKAVEVIDRGSAIKGNHIDVFFPTHEQALEWGRRRLPVTLATDPS